MARAEAFRFEANGRTLTGVAFGDPAAPPLLALHGWLDNAASFAALAPKLAESRYVIALDLRGHGASSHLPAGAWYHYVDYFDDIHAAFDHFGWMRAELLGHSLGGTLASLFAALHPDLVSALLTIEALGPLTVDADHALDQLRRGLDERSAFARRRPLRVFATIDDAIALRAAASATSIEAARPIVERGVVAVDGGFVWSSDPRLTLTSPQRYTEEQIVAMLSAIRAPTLMILAEPATSYLPDARMAARAAVVTGIEVVRLPGGHHLHLEDAAGVANAIENFWRQRKLNSSPA
jgi:pimeloyl-ACP methyl ester carboxylesterase